MSRPRRDLRRLFVLSVLLGAAYLLWRWRQQQADALSLPDSYSPPGAAPRPAPAALTAPQAGGLATAPAAGPRRIPTRVHRGAPPSRPLASAALATEPGGAAPAAMDGVSALGAAAPAEQQGDAPSQEQADGGPAALAPVPDGVPETMALADEASATTFTPGLAPPDHGDAPTMISADSPDTVSEARAPTPPSPSVAASGVGLININTAGEDALVALPGIGRALARRIIARREQRGPYATVDELIDIQGIGPRNIDDFRAFITV